MKNISLEELLDKANLVLAAEELGKRINYDDALIAVHRMSERCGTYNFSPLYQSIDFDEAINYFGMQHKPYYRFYSDIIRVNNVLNGKPANGSPATLMTLNASCQFFYMMIALEIKRRLNKYIERQTIASE